MTIDELRQRLKDLQAVIDKSAMQHNMLLGRLQESQERLHMAETREAEAAKPKTVKPVAVKKTRTRMPKAKTAEVVAA